MKQIDWNLIKQRQDKNPWSIYRDATLRFARHLLNAPPPQIDESRHNWLLEQARVTGKYIITLAGAYRLTEDIHYAERAWFFMEDALNWPRWFWLGDPRTQGFALSSGELAITCAFLEDWMGDYLSEERRELLDTAIRRRIFGAYLEVTAPGREVVWYRSTINWNAVCNGGVLTLALLRGDRDPQAAAVRERALTGLQYYIEGLHPDGSLPESIGYWQYGIIHLGYVLLAMERFLQKRQPAFAGGALREGLSFPFDFTPSGGAAVGFGDCNIFWPQGFLFALAGRADRSDVTDELHRRMSSHLIGRTPGQFDPFEDYHPSEIFSLVYSAENLSTPWPRSAFKKYPDVGWGVFASGPLTLGFRAGSSDVSHSMRDLCAVNLARDGVALFAYVENIPYIRGWFNYQIPRGESRHLFFEDNSTSKNTLLINGIGQITRADSDWDADETSMWCDATAAYSWFVRRMKRTVQLSENGFILIDDMESDAECWHEARFLTSGRFSKIGDTCVQVEHHGKTAKLTIFAKFDIQITTVPCAQSNPTKPPLQMLRIYNTKPSKNTTWEIHISQ